jgi:hypothetical protein
MHRRSVRRILTGLTLGGAVAVAGHAQFAAPDPPRDPSVRARRLFERDHPHQNAALRVGERYVFSVRYGMIRAGTAEIGIAGTTTIDGDSCYHYLSTAASNDFFSTFFLVRDSVESYTAVSDLLPRRFEKHLREGNYARDDTMRFDQRNHLALYPSGRIVELLPGTHDILSAFFEVRTRELHPGDVLDLECHADGKNYPLKTQVYRRERVSVPAGDFDCLVVEPMLRTPGLFRHEGSLTLWLTDDARKIPVQMKSRLAIGSISVVLTAIEEPGGTGSAR